MKKNADVKMLELNPRRRMPLMPVPFSRRLQEGKAGWILLWLLGVPLPILFILYLLRGCT